MGTILLAILGISILFFIFLIVFEVVMVLLSLVIGVAFFVIIVGGAFLILRTIVKG